MGAISGSSTGVVLDPPSLNVEEMWHSLAVPNRLDFSATELARLPTAVVQKQIGDHCPALKVEVVQISEAVDPDTAH